METISEAVLSQLLAITVKATALITVTMGLARLLRSPSARALLWSAAMASLLFLPIAATLRIGPEVDWAASRDRVSGYSSLVAEVSLAPDPQASSVPAAQPVPWAAVVLGLYLSGVVIGLGRVGVGLWLARQFRHTARPIEDTQRLAAWCQRLGVRTPVAWAISTRIGTPSLVGWRRPLILVPDRLSGPNGPDSQVGDAILAHELVHLRRGDPVWNLIGLIAVSLYWFHPMVHRARRNWQRDNEMACDDETVLHLGDARAYGTVLLASSSARQPELVEACTVDMARPGRISARVERLLEGGAYRLPLGRKQSAAGIAGMMLLAGCFGGSHVPDPPSVESRSILALSAQPGDDGILGNGSPVVSNARSPAMFGRRHSRRAGFWVFSRQQFVRYRRAVQAPGDTSAHRNAGLTSRGGRFDAGVNLEPILTAFHTKHGPHYFYKWEDYENPPLMR